MAQRDSSFPSPQFGNRSKGLVETVDHECLIWTDIEAKSLRDLIQISPHYSPIKSLSLDASFEAAVISTGSKKVSELTVRDATALTAALAHNIQKDPSGYEAHYTALMRQVWRNLAETTKADTPDKEQASYTELNQLIQAFDSIAPRDSHKQAVATAANLDHRMRQDLNAMARSISQLSLNMNDRDRRDEGFMGAVRERLRGVRVCRDGNSQDNQYVLVFSVPTDTRETLLEHTQSIREYLMGHDIQVGDIKSNGILMTVKPEKDSLFDRTLQALNKEGKMIR